MLIKSALITQISGSLGGMTGSHNRGGNYLRARAIPVNPNSPQQQAVRNAMTDLVGRWGGVLTPAQRDGWSDYAESTPVLNSLGDEVTLSGINMYTSSNIPRVQAGLDIVDDRPPFNNFGEAQEFVLSNASAGSGEFDVVYGTPGAWADEDGSALLVYSSRPVNPAVRFFRGPYRFAAAVLGDSTTPPTSPETVTSPFGLIDGSVLHVQARVTRADGRLSPVFRGLIDVGA